MSDHDRERADASPSSSDTASASGDTASASGDTASASSDPVLVRRAKLLRLTSVGQRIGYTCFGLAMVLFVIALITQLPSWLVTTIIVLMLVGSAVLLPAIILSYGAKAADREDRGEPFTY